jgi:ketosteroid isomerase-like protein
VLGALALLACGCARTATPDPCAAEFDEAAVVAVLEAQRVAWNAGDLDGFLAGYEQSPALLFTSGAKIRRGFTETRDKYRARYGQARATMGVLAFEILDVRSIGQCSDAAIVLGRWAVSESPESGSGVFSVILERHEDRWEIIHDHTSSDPPDL